MKLLVCLAIAFAPLAFAAERTEQFDTDPAWDGKNNRPSPETLREVAQDFALARAQAEGADFFDRGRCDGGGLGRAEVIPGADSESAAEALR